MADKEAERIKFETELLRISALFVLAVGGGSISLLLGEPTFLRLILAVGGLFVTFGLAVTGWRQRTRIQHLVEEIQETPWLGWRLLPQVSG